MMWQKKQHRHNYDILVWLLLLKMVHELVTWLHIMAPACLCLDAYAQQLCLPHFTMFPPIPFLSRCALETA